MDLKEPNSTIGSTPVIVTNFLSDTTAHGFSKLTTSSVGLKRIWTLILLIAFAGFSRHLGVVITRYLSVPTSTVIRAKAGHFQFPDVTICPDNRRSLLRRKEDDGTIPLLFEGEEVTSSDAFKLFTTFWKNFNLTLNSTEDEMKPLARRSLLPFLRYTTTRKEPQDVIVNCQYSDLVCTPWNFTKIFHPEFHRCFLFQPSQRELSGTDIEDGLSIIAYLADADNTMKSSDEYVFVSKSLHVYIHQAGTSPRMGYTNIKVPVGYKTVVSLEMSIMENLNLDREPCVPPTNFIHSYNWNADVNLNYTYTADHCIQEKIQDEFIKQCGCLDENKMVSEYQRYWPGCHSIDSITIMLDGNQSKTLEIKNSSVTNHSLLVSERVACFQSMTKKIVDISDMVATKCSAACRAELYPMEIYREEWPSNLDYIEKKTMKSMRKYYEDIMKRHEELKKINLNEIPPLVANNILNIKNRFAIRKIERIRQGFATINILPKSLSSQVSKEEFAYPFESLISDIGGALGLWIGVSFVTVLEVFELIANLAKQFIRRFFTRKHNINTNMNVEL